MQRIVRSMKQQVDNALLESRYYEMLAQHKGNTTMTITKDRLNHLIRAGLTQDQICSVLAIDIDALQGLITTYWAVETFDAIAAYLCTKVKFHLDKYVLISEHAWELLREIYREQHSVSGDISTHMGTVFTPNAGEVYGAHAVQSGGQLAIEIFISHNGDKSRRPVTFPIIDSMLDDIYESKMIPTVVALGFDEMLLELR